MDSAQVTALQTELLGYVATTSGLVVAVGLALIGLGFTYTLLRKGKRAASGRI